MCGFRGGKGGPDPSGKSQVIWVSIEISIWTTLENVGPHGSFEKYSFLCNKTIEPP